VTGKDRTSVQIFFESFDQPLESSRIYDKDVAHDKLGAIRMIVGKAGWPLASTLFVDDNIYHLLPADHAGCCAFMADWGYHTAEQMEAARRRSIPILKLETWADTLLQWKVPA
jgi:phosphoglycolate phosphatase-like HAD superfamily hydrolase